MDSCLTIGKKEQGHQHGKWQQKEVILGGVVRRGRGKGKQSLISFSFWILFTLYLRVRQTTKELKALLRVIFSIYYSFKNINILVRNKIPDSGSLYSNPLSVLFHYKQSSQLHPLLKHLLPCLLYSTVSVLFVYNINTPVANRQLAPTHSTTHKKKTKHTLVVLAFSLTCGASG